MPTCSQILAAIALVVFGVLHPTPANAASTVLSGIFTGSEPTMVSFWGCSDDALAYQQLPFEVSQDGLYQDGAVATFASTNGATSARTRVYEGGFDPEQPEQNAINLESVGWFGGYSLSAGTRYVLVVQGPCQNVEGPWAMAFIGPGIVISEATVELPEFSTGVLRIDDPKMPAHCGGRVVEGASFRQSGPIQVSRTGNYYYSSVVINNGALVCLSIYTAPVDPLNPAANRVAMLGGYDLTTAELQAGRDYYFVTQWNGDEIDDSSPNSAGEFLHILMPPAPVRVNRGLAGSWYDPDIPGQGFFLTVYEKLNQVFLGWFTYAIDPPAGDDFGHRWMTAFGPFADTSAELAISWTAGGRFNIANPAPEQHQNGVIELEFTDCTSGQMTYSWSSDEPGSPAASGVIPIERIANDSVVLCESLYAGPGMPGPL